MKIAIVFSTQLRTIKYTKQNLIEFFGEFFNQIDFFCHTWDVSYCTTRDAGIIRWDNVEEQDMEKYKSLLMDSNVEKDFISTFTPRKYVKETLYKYQLNNKKNGKVDFPMWYSIWAGNELKKQYEIENKFEYDIVIKVRGDLFFYNNKLINDILDYLIENKKKGIPLYYYVEDFYFLTDSKTMDLLCEYGNPELEIYKKYNNLPWGHVDYIKEIGVERVLSRTQCGLYRVTAIGLDLKTELEEIFNIYKNYYKDKN
jgi:hypothetical protein